MYVGEKQDMKWSVRPTAKVDGSVDNNVCRYRSQYSISDVSNTYGDD